MSSLSPAFTLLIQALGAVAGLRSPGVPVRRPVPIVLAFNVTKDRINPYTDSDMQRWIKSVSDAARSWALATASRLRRRESR